MIRREGDRILIAGAGITGETYRRLPGSRCSLPFRVSSRLPELDREFTEPERAEARFGENHNPIVQSTCRDPLGPIYKPLQAG